MNNINIKRVDTSLPLPEYKTEGALGIDLYARETVTFVPFEAKLVRLNTVVKVPDNYGTFITPRSSLYKNKGLILTNSVGVIDRDYCGEEDEIMAMLYHLPAKNIHNFTGSVTIEKGERVAQMLIFPVGKQLAINETDKMAEVSRGGYGSTGGYNNEG